MLNRFWNGKIKGFLSAVFLVIGASFYKFRTKLTTILFVVNIKKHGKHIVVLPGISYRNPKKITVGNNCIIGRNAKFTTELFECGGELVISDDSSIGSNCKIDFTGGLILKQSAHIAHNVLILTHTHGYDYESEPIGSLLEIDEHAFIGSNSIISYNCNRIGKNAVIGTGSVVTKNVPDHAVVVGNPARIIRYINDGEKS